MRRANDRPDEDDDRPRPSFAYSVGKAVGPPTATKVAVLVGGLGVMMSILVAVASCDSRPRPSTGAPPPAQRHRLREVARMYAENAARAAEYFKGGAVDFEMRVDAIRTSYGRRMIVVEEARDGTSSQYGAIFPERHTSRLARLNPGDTVRGHGRLSHTVGGVVLDDCEFDD